MIKIQATIIGYGGIPCSLFSAYDPDAGILVVSKEAEYRRERLPECFVLTNDVAIARDGLFTDDDLKDAIAAFFTLKNGVAVDGKSKRIVFADQANRANPEQSIEKDGVDPSGPRYRVSDAVTCSQIAALATCRHALRSEAIERTVDMADSLRALLRGGIVTI